MLVIFGRSIRITPQANGNKIRNFDEGINHRFMI